MNHAQDTILDKAVTGTDEVYSESVDMRYKMLFWLIVGWTSTATGTATLQESADGTNWIDTSLTVTVTGTPGQGTIQSGDKLFAASYLRLKYKNTTGSGNVKAVMVAKG